MVFAIFHGTSILLFGSAYSHSGLRDNSFLKRFNAIPSFGILFISNSLQIYSWKLMQQRLTIDYLQCMAT
jgi:hypothetical protein